MGDPRPEVSSSSHAWDEFYENAPQEPPRPEHPKGSSQADERVSHVLARILRYHAQSIGLQPDEEGWVQVSQMLTLQELALLGADEDDVQRVAGTSVSTRGPRFETQNGAAGLQIRAFYKHPPSFGFKDVGRGSRGYRHDGPARGYNGYRQDRRNYQDFDRRDDRRDDMRRHSPPRARRGFSREEPPASPGRSPREAESSSRSDIPAGPSSPAREAAGNPLATAASPAPDCPAPARNSPMVAAPNLEATIPAWISRKGPEAAEEPPRKDPTTTAVHVEEDAGAQEPEVWEKYHEPKTQRMWFWHEATEEVFYADDGSSGWERFEDPRGEPWWWHEESGRYFVEAD